MTDTVAFVVVGWNNKDLLDECLTSIAAQTYPHIVTYYVDNGSTDGSADYVRTRFPEVKVVLPGYNTGFARGNNIGIREALRDPSTRYIALLNSDARLDADWATHIVDFAVSRPHAALLQGTTLDYYDHRIIDSTHIYVSLNGQGTQGRWRYYYRGEPGPRKIFGVNAAACMITRSFIEQQPFAELFDETMFMYLEDVDLSFRATVMGWDNYLVPHARAYHMGSATSGKNPGFSLYMTFRNNAALLYKNLPWTTLGRMLPHIIRGDVDTVKVLWRLGKKHAVLKVIEGRIVGIIRLPLFARKRRTMLRASTIPKGYLSLLMRKGY